jgi:hypothetical protein
MKIIKEHRMQVVRDALFKKLKILMNKEPRSKRKFWQCFYEEEKVFTNKHIIDEYIDEFWVLNCPETYSISQVDD